jgi:hypothetical protein
MVQDTVGAAERTTDLYEAFKSPDSNENHLVFLTEWSQFGPQRYL